MPPKRKRPVMRDDSQLQPESGYPSGRLPMKPSAHPHPKAGDEDTSIRGGAGSEAEFGKLRST